MCTAHGRPYQRLSLIHILLSEDKPNGEKEKIMPIEVNIKGVKKQIIKKTCGKKIINTREELEMNKGGVINVFNIPIGEQRELTLILNLIKLSKINHHSCLLYTSRCV